MATNTSLSSEIEPENHSQNTRLFMPFVYGVFFWSMAGVVVIYGIRLYHDIPIHHSFIPIIGGVFAAVLSFTLVMTFKIVSGPINIQSGAFKLEGAGGPIVLWCVCFLSTSYGLYLLGLVDVAKMEDNKKYISCSVSEATQKACISQQKEK